MPKIFLSHSSRDKFFVRKLAERLQTHGVQVWLDEAEIKIGDSLTAKIGAAIDDTDYFGVVLSHNSVNSEWVQRELQVAMQRELVSKRVIILPMLIESVQIPAFLRDKLYADFTAPDTEAFEAAFRKLLNTLGVSSAELVEKPKAEQVELTRPVPLVIERKEPSPPSLPKSHAASQLADYQDIRITGLDDARSYNPDRAKLLYNMYLSLSAQPPNAWQLIFEAERRFPRHSMWRRAWVEGEYIVIHCVPEELEQYHLADLNVDVGNSNTRYRQHLIQQAQAELRRFQEERKNADSISDLKRRLKFD